MNKDEIAGLVEDLREDGLHRAADALTTLSARIEALEAALENLIAHCHEQDRLLTEDLHHTDFCGESIVLLGARQALAGDTNHG